MNRGARAWQLPVAALLLAAVTIAVYGQVVRHEFLSYDDQEYVAANRQVQAGLTLGGIRWAFTTGITGNWHPLTWISIMFDCQLFGLNPGAHHVMSVLLHAANAVLLLLILARATGSPWKSLFVAALFALHPIHVESVAWASERKDVLSTLLWMLTMGAYVRYAERPSPRWLGAALVPFAFGLMAKPMLVTLPFVLLLLDVWPLGRLRLPWGPGAAAGGGEDAARAVRAGNGPSAGRARASVAGSAGRPRATLASLLLEKTPFFALTVVSSAVTFYAQRRIGVVASTEQLPLEERMANALVSYAEYLVKTIWPTRLAVIYPHLGMPPAWKVVASGVLFAGVSYAVLRLAPRRPYLAVGWLWYAGTLVPVIGLVQVGVQALADRYSYVPLIGIFIMVAWGVPDLLARWRWRKEALAAAALVIVAACVPVTWRQIGHWRNNFTLYRHAIEVTENNVVALNNLGVALDRQGRHEEAVATLQRAMRVKSDHADVNNNLAVALANAGRPDEAVAHYEAAIRINPRLASARFNYGNALLKMGQRAKAIERFEEAVRIDPAFGPARYNLAGALIQERRFEDARGHLEALLRLDPGDPLAHRGLGVVLAAEGRLDDAIRELGEALRIDPSDATAHKNLGLALARKGRAREAPGHYLQALRIAPDDSEALDNLAMIRAAHPDAALRDGREAVRLAERACTLTQGRSAGPMRTLAMAYAESGRFGDAAETARKARDLALASGQSRLASEIEGQIDLYRQDRPWRETFGEPGTVGR